MGAALHYKDDFCLRRKFRRGNKVALHLLSVDSKLLAAGLNVTGIFDRDAKLAAPMSLSEIRTSFLLIGVKK